MVLILDPFQEIKTFERKRSKLRDVDKVDALVLLYEKFLYIHESFLEEIDEIIIINFLETDPISESIFQKSLHKIKRLRKFTTIAYLLDSAKIFNFQSQEQFYLFVNSLIREYQKKQFIFFDIFLTPLMPYILFGCENIQGYRAVIMNNKIIEWEKIENVRKYIFCGIALTYKHFDNDPYELALIENSKEYLPSVINQFVGLIKDGLNYQMIWFTKDEVHKRSLLLYRLNQEIGDFQIHNCKIDGLILRPDFDRYIIYGIEDLSESNRYKFLNSIITKSCSTKKIIFIVERKLDLSEFPLIRFWYEFHEDPSQIFIDYVLPVIKSAYNVFNKKLVEYKHLFKRILHGESDKFINDYLEKLFVMSVDIYETSKINFFYDLDSQELNEIGSELKPFSTIFRELETTGEKEVHTIKITHDIEHSLWVIKKDKEPSIKLSYTKYIGIKYIAYLWQHYKSKSISDTELRRVVEKWHGSKKKKSAESSDAKTISGNIKYLFKKEVCPNLAELDPCLKITSTTPPGCYFQEISGLNLIVDDEQIPLPI